MDADGDKLALTATALSNFLGCRHRIGLEMAVAGGKLRRPKYDDPQLEALFRRGLEHERKHVASFAASGTGIVDLSEVRNDAAAVERTLAAMREGADVIVQTALSDGAWHGRPDLLVKVATPSKLGAWSYEVEDTKLARETRVG